MIPSFDQYDYNYVVIFDRCCKCPKTLLNYNKYYDEKNILPMHLYRVD